MEPLALYIHWPFCLAKCPYCDFNSHVRERIAEARFAAALRTELAWEATRLGRRPLTSIFFGGGTPSLMAPETIAGLIEDAHALFDPAPDVEITLEANPTSVEASRLAGFRDAGVNRVSLGVQSSTAAGDLAAQQAVATQVDASRESVSGVNMDDEMTSMLQYQHAYAAAGKLVSAIDQMLDTVINMVGS